MGAQKMSQAKIYLALYKGRRDGTDARVWAARFSDWLTRKLTRGIYSHCEIAVATDVAVGTITRGQYKGRATDIRQFDCYSSSIRDGGVRHKTMPLPATKWDLIPLTDPSGSLKANLAAVFARTQGQCYDLAGALGVVFKTRQRHDRWFCSEWCGQVLGLPESWRFSPNDLAAIAQGCLKEQAEGEA